VIGPTPQLLACGNVRLPKSRHEMLAHVGDGGRLPSLPLPLCGRVLGEGGDQVSDRAPAVGGELGESVPDGRVDLDRRIQGVRMPPVYPDMDLRFRPVPTGRRSRSVAGPDPEEPLWETSFEQDQYN
jgi:hypothetical protein